MIILFMLIFMVTAKATEETKYIDLLPEEEKEIFLERIARRILEEVDLKPSQQKNSGEVPVHELDIHDEFIKKILREEEANLRKQNSNDNGDLSVKPLRKDRKTIDLTLRSRTKRNNNPSFRRNSDANSDLENNKQKDTSTGPGSQSDEKDIQVKDFNSKSEKNNNKVEREANNDEVQTISTDKVDDKPEKPLTEHKDHVVRINTFNFGSIDESKINKTNTEETNSSKLKPEGKRSFLRSNISQNINDENQQEKKPIDEKEISTKLDLSSDKEKRDTGNISFKEIPVQILHYGDFDTIKEEITTKKQLEEPPTEKIIYTTTPKLIDDTETTEKGETTTKTNKSEDKAKEIIKRDVTAVTDKIETHKEVNNDETERLPIKNFRINTVNFGDVKESKIDTTNNTKNNSFIDLESISKSSDTIDSKPMRIKPLTEKHISDKNDEIISASSEKMDIISEVHKDIINEDKINKEGIKGTLKSVVENHKNGDDTVKQNIYHIEKMILRDTNDVKPITTHNLEVTTQKIEVLTPLIPLTAKYISRTKEDDIKDAKEADSNIIRVLRDVIDRNRVDANGKFDSLKSINKMKEHKVYELPTSDKILFIDGTMNKEQPHYYPIYNYSPNNAYYNAHNNFGPNTNDFEFQRNKDQGEDDKGKDNFQTDYFFDETSKRFADLDASDHIKQKYEYKLPLFVKYSTNLNTDYDVPGILRNTDDEDSCPKSSEENDDKPKDNDDKPKDNDDKPNDNDDISNEDNDDKSNEDNDEKSNEDNDDKSVEDNVDTPNKDDDEGTLKSNLEKIRMMMHANKWYGKPRNKTFTYKYNSQEVIKKKSHLRAKFEAILEREKNERENRKTVDDSNIAVDYYFSRMNGNSNTNQKDEYKKIHTDLHSIKDVIQGIFNKNNYKIYFIDSAQLKPKVDAQFKARKNENKPNFEKIRKILNFTNEEDMIPILNKLLEMNIQRSTEKGKNVEIFADVLADLVQTDNSALVQYNWLGTTVNIQGATLKLLELTQMVLRNRYVNPSDLELLKYIVFLFKQANIMLHNKENVRMKLPRGKNMKRKIIKTYRQLQFRQSENKEEKLTRKDIEIFEEFLDEILNSLYELHTAIKQVAGITKYNHQHWFKNLKELYLDRTPIRSLELLLHLTMNRILDLVETSAKNGLENDYLKYARHNEKEVSRTIGEFVFLLKIVNEIEKNE